MHLRRWKKSIEISKARDWKIVEENFCINKAYAGVYKIEIELFNSTLHYLLITLKAFFYWYLKRWYWPYFFGFFIGLHMQKTAFWKYSNSTWKLSLVEKPRKKWWYFNPLIVQYLC